MQSAFRSFAKEIDHRDEIRESLVKLSRDITRSSKKLLFSLHRGDPFDQIDSQLVQVRSLLHRIGSTEDHARHSRSYSPGVQEYVEAEVFAKYLREHSLVRIHEINDALDGFTVSHEDYLLGLLDAT
jgi:predicted translin family RNA/ssDNA-binding protein